ncbi:MAG: hypothetical protein AAB691_03660 [Patescibacteria group bacterium]
MLTVVSELFQPDVLFPAQFYASFQQGARGRSEKRLMLAVLEDAVDCYKKYAFSCDGKARQLFSEAETWINSQNRNWFFSFVNICETLGLNPDYLRRGLHEWRERYSVPSERRERATLTLDEELVGSLGRETSGY